MGERELERYMGERENGKDNLHGRERELERYMRQREGKITYMGERVGKKNLHTGRREAKESDGRKSGSK